MTHVGNDTVRKDCIINNMTTSFLAPGKGKDGEDLNRVKALEYIIKNSVDRDLKTKFKLDPWRVPKVAELFYKEGHNAMILNSKIKNVIIRWDVKQHALRTIALWNGKVDEINDEKRSDPIESEVLIW